MKTVIVESPAKAKTINKYLGKDYKVLASFGHIRDLPSKDGSVDTENDFAMKWEVDSDSKKRIKEIADSTKGSDELILATDLDREGEAIAWHVLEVLKAKRGVMKDVNVKRVVFNEITKTAILKAMDEPRDVDNEMVDAYLARRALDYLVGFNLSPVLWRKLPGSKSAGRVQSVALRLICERELDIEKFISEEYWSIEARLKNSTSKAFTARLTTLNGEKLEKFTLNNEEKANAAKAAVEGASFSVKNVISKPTKRHPAASFTTSTLQQEASRKLGFNAQRTMRTAQKLYEGIDIKGETTGLITYMRTDGVNIAGEAINDARSVIGSKFGSNYVPAKPNFYKNKAKNAQEAHEAIRPTSLSRLPEDVANRLDDDQKRLYELIWKRTIASQMADAQMEQTTADMVSENGQTILRATGTVQVFDGFLTLYQEGKDDSTDEDEKRLPKLSNGENIDKEKIDANQHFTSPPPRFTEASLVKRMEELGIGRPSTYASILTVLRDRNYVEMDKNRFVPEGKGRVVTSFLESYFNKYVQYDFTADLEAELDKVSDGQIPWKEVLANFWLDFSKAVDGTKDLRVSEVLDVITDALAPFIFKPREDGSNPRTCPKCNEGGLSVKTGKFGAFIGCENYPTCNFTRQFGNGNEEQSEDGGPKTLGIDPTTGMEVTLRTGRFGPYIQLGEPVEKEKPKRASIPKGMPADTLDFERALKLLALPRDVGVHPEDGKVIKAAIGPYGPYVSHNRVFASLKDPEDVFNIGINHAVTLIAETIAKKGKAAEPIKDLGEHPDGDGNILVMEGRYGPYVKYKRINATIPKDKDPKDVTVEEAIELIKERAAKGKKPKAKPKKKPKAKAKAKKKAKAK
ncbi:MAG: type I DNA topoisomerase [Kordiimonadaceae bacterium]|jgi:DNA topoisomerase I|nr:type I DNA topoisomerase [Kordiimonadaceae bacterium]MBT6037566.1 type I DNA topoisomerase [Kordiimonadaceae bacterium]MBT7581461.1 type I DNA topoisomerase [Kordiimonadaceae bacterium]